MRNRVKPKLSPARQKLAAAIAELQALEATLPSRNRSSLGLRGIITPPSEDAEDPLHEAVEEAERAVGDAAAKREAALRGCPGYPYVSIEAAPSFVRLADAEWREAKQHLDATRKTLVAAEEQHRPVRLAQELHQLDELKLRKARVADAVRAVIAEAPGVQELLRALHRYRVEEQRILGALHVIGRASALALPGNWNPAGMYDFKSSDPRWSGDQNLARQWERAIHGLSVDPTFPVPGDARDDEQADAA